MKKLYLLFFVAASFSCLIGCAPTDKDSTEGSLTSFAYPSLTTLPPDSVTPTSAIVGGNVTADNGAPVTRRGVIFGFRKIPTAYFDSTIELGTGVGIFTCKLESLNKDSVYYIRTFAINSGGINYGNIISLITAHGLGQNFGGGIVYYVTSNYRHGLIA